MYDNPKQAEIVNNTEISLSYSISIDWLQVHVQNSHDFLEITQTARYKIQRTGQTKVFADVFSISDLRGKHIASYATGANECILKENHGILKIDNQQLYTNLNLKAFMMLFLEELKMKFIGITRLDICYDFNKFYNNVKPHDFITDFVTGKILKINRTKFRLAGEHDKINIFNWLFFGSHTSEVCYKIYNKTLEQKQCENKPYIFEHWKKNTGLNLDQEVWRIEFTVHSTTAKLCNDFIDIPFHSLDVLSRGNYYNLFAGLFKHYFRFVKNSGKDERKSRMDEIKLIEFETVIDGSYFELFKEINPERKNSTRSKKIFINAMNTHRAELKEFDGDFDLTSKDIISKLIDLYCLQTWAKNKGIEFNEMQYTEAIHDYKTEID